MDFFKKSKGKIKDIPLIIRENVYTCLKEIDFDEIDKILHANGGGIICEETEGLRIIIFKDSIIVLIKMNYYDLNIKELSEDRILTFNIKRNEIENLCE